MPYYFNRDGHRIDAAKFQELQADPAYTMLKEFDNGAVRVRLVWLGKVSDREHSTWRDTWPLFTMSVWNYTAEGKLVPDPVANGQTFASEHEALNAYEEFLITWADCEIGDNGNLIEKDNLLAPPPPPDPDKPASEFKLDDDNDAAW